MRNNVKAKGNKKSSFKEHIAGNVLSELQEIGFLYQIKGKNRSDDGKSMGLDSRSSIA